MFFVALQLWWVDRITRIGRAAYAPKRCLNTLMNIERETFFGKQIMCFVTLWSKDITILCGLENNTRQQTTHTISATNWSLRVLVYTYKVNHIFLKFLKCDADEPIQYFWNFKRRRLPWSFQVNERKNARKECGAIQYLNINTVSQLEMQNCIKTTSFCKTPSENDYVSFFKGVNRCL